MGAVPVFEPDGGPALVLARGLAVAFILSVAGTATFRAVVLPRALVRMTPGVAGRIERALARWLRVSALGAALGLMAWFIALTANLASPQGIADWADGLWGVLADTSFGHVLLLQATLLAGAVVVLGRRPSILRWWVCCILATAAAVAETGHGHAFAMAQGLSILEVSEALHLWAAGAWLGGLVPLLLVVLAAPPADAAVAARWFSPLGQVCLVVLALSALLQGWVLIAGIAALKDTAYGWTAMLKLCLYGMLFGFAVLNRYRLCPALRTPEARAARGALIASLVLQTAFGVLVVLAAALLGQLRPGMDMGIAG
jgi:putative copper resistance protein D